MSSTSRSAALALLVAGAAVGQVGLQVELSPVLLPESYWTGWREDVDHLLTRKESAKFAALDAEGERHAFVDAFWTARDPTPDTGRNEARERFFRLLRRAEAAYPRPGDPRTRAILRLGWPLYRQSFGDWFAGPSVGDIQTYASADFPKSRCTVPHMDLLFFDGNEAREPMTVTFYRRFGRCRRLKPGDALLPDGVSNELMFRTLDRQYCFQAYPAFRPYLERALRGIPSEEDLVAAALEVPVVVGAAARAGLRKPRADPDARLRVAWGPQVVRGSTPARRYTTGAAVLELSSLAISWPDDLAWLTVSVSAELVDTERQLTTYRSFGSNFFDSGSERIEIPFPLEALEGRHLLLLPARVGEDVLTPLAFELVVPRESPGSAPRPGPVSLIDVLEAAPSVRLPEYLAGLVIGEQQVKVATRGAVARVAYRLGGEEVAAAGEAPFSATIDFGEGRGSFLCVPAFRWSYPTGDAWTASSWRPTRRRSVPCITHRGPTWPSSPLRPIRR